MSNQYATAAELVARSPGLATRGAVELDAALTAASRWIDGYCSRKFWLDPVVTDRVFQPSDWYIVDLGVHEIGAAAGVVVKTDDGSGVFATTVSASAYQLEPVNAPYDYQGPAPYTRVRALSTPWSLASYFGPGRQEQIKITARYGWPEVPAAVHEACMTLVVDHFENPSGVRSEAIDGYSVSYRLAGDGLTGTAAAVATTLAYLRKPVLV